MAEVLMVGSVALDSVETPYGKVERALGGAATYAGCAASFFSGVRIVGVVGEDFEPAHLDFLASRKIDTAGVQRVPGKTFHWAGRYEGDMNAAITLSTELNVFETFDPVLPESYRQTPYVFLANIHPALQLKVLDQMARPKFVALDTMNFWIESEIDLLRQVIGRVDMLVVNDGETRLLTGQGNLLKGARELLAMGPRIVVVKKGEHGAMLFCGDGIFSLPGYPLASVCDPTGCGDSFAGGFIGYVASAESQDEATLRRAMVYGSVIASFNVEDFSLERQRRLTRSEIEERFDGFVALTRFDRA